MRLFLSVVLLIYGCLQYVYGYTVAVNSNRKFLFGDVLEPLVSVDLKGDSLPKAELVELFHTWELFTSSQISSSLESDYRKAMPCFPGPNLNATVFNNDTIPPYPDCDTFVNISKTTIGEADDLLEEMKKDKNDQQMDVSLKSVMNSLSNRLQNLIDYLPNGSTKQKIENQLSTLVSMSTLNPIQNTTWMPHHNPRNHSSPPSPSKFNPSQLLSCINISSFSPSDLLTLAGQTIGSVACSRFQICSFSDLSRNPCLGALNITENQYDTVINKTIGELLKQKIGGSVIGQFFGQFGRFKRTPEPEECEEVTPMMKMDGREEEEEESVENGGTMDMSYGEIDSEDVLKRKMKEEEEKSSEDLSNSTDTSELIGELKDLKRKHGKVDTSRPGCCDYTTLEGSSSKVKGVLDFTKSSKDVENLLESPGEGSGETLSNEHFKDALDSFRTQDARKADAERSKDMESSGEGSGEEYFKTQDELKKKSRKIDMAGCCDYTVVEDLLGSLEEGSGEVGVSEAPKDKKLFGKRTENEDGVTYEMKENPDMDGSGNDDNKKTQKVGLRKRLENIDGSGEPLAAINVYERVQDQESSGLKDARTKIPTEEKMKSGTEDGVTYHVCCDPTPEGLGATESGKLSDGADSLLQDLQETKDQSNTNFDQALSYFKLSSTNTSIPEFSELQTLLGTNLNKSVVEYGNSFMNSSDPWKQKVENILPEMGNDFTVLDMLKKLKISDWSSLGQLLEPFGAMMGGLDVSGVLKTLASSGIDLNTVLNSMNSDGSTSIVDKLVDTVKKKISDISSPASATIPPAVLTAIKSNDTSSLVANAMSFLKKNPSVASKLNL